MRNLFDEEISPEEYQKLLDEQFDDMMKDKRLAERIVKIDMEIEEKEKELHRLILRSLLLRRKKNGGY